MRHVYGSNKPFLSREHVFILECNFDVSYDILLSVPDDYINKHGEARVLPIWCPLGVPSVHFGVPFGVPIVDWV